jgi:hypothetical protein
MTPASLACTTVLLLSLGAPPTAADRVAFTEYQQQLARTMAADSGPTPTSLAAAQGTCLLPGASGAALSTRECVACHSGHDGHRSHPVDVDHESARYRTHGSGPGLRPAAEVVKLGVFLPDGKVTCLTCHDGASPWKYRLAIPPEARLRDPVHPGDPRTYDPAVTRVSVTRGLDATTARKLLPAGTEVSPTPLCKACHSFD